MTGPIDCDVHPTLPSMATLMPYLPRYWREVFTARGLDRMDYQLTADPRSTPLHARPDWRADGGPAKDVATLQRHLLDPFGLGHAILNCMHAGMLMFSEDMAAVVCRAVNEWLAREWLDRDPRLRAAITVPLGGVELAVAEIERCAADPRFVQVLVPVSHEAPLGRRQFWPIWRAAEQHGLPVAIHAGSAYRQAPTATGWPSTFIEDHVAESQAFESAVLSLLAEGVFEACPRLTVVLAESGVAWMPGFLWRANKMWRGVRTEVPWLKREPAETIRRHVRLTMQPLDLPEDAARFARFRAQLNADEMLLFASDYPHHHFEGQAALGSAIPEELRRRIGVDNPLATYPRLAVAQGVAA